MPLRHQRPRRRCDKPSRNASAYQSGNIDSRPGTQHRAPRGPLAPNRKGRERAGKGAANSLMFGSICPQKQNSFVLDVAAAIKGRIDGDFSVNSCWAGSGRHSLLRSSRRTRFRDDAEGLDVVLIQRAGASDFWSSDVLQCAGDRKRVSSP